MVIEDKQFERFGKEVVERPLIQSNPTRGVSLGSSRGQKCVPGSFCRQPKLAVLISKQAEFG